MGIHLLSVSALPGPKPAHYGRSAPDSWSTRKSCSLCPRIESLKRMEFFLNTAWALLALLVLCLWLRIEHRAHSKRGLPFVSLVMLIVMLFPVISVSDDLWSLQNPAETDTCLRRVHPASFPHSDFPAMDAHPEPVFYGATFGDPSIAVPEGSPLLRIDNPALHSVQTRPPPAV